jgi:hypothetical protein
MNVFTIAATTKPNPPGMKGGMKNPPFFLFTGQVRGVIETPEPLAYM